jgi:hypothetical protein
VPAARSGKSPERRAHSLGNRDERVFTTLAACLANSLCSAARQGLQRDEPEDSEGDHDSSAFIGHDGYVGSADDKPRKRRHPLRKVPKYETPNTLPLPGLTGESEFGQSSSRFGHGSDGKEYGRPGLIGRGFLRILGMRQRGAAAERSVTPEAREKESPE